MRMGGIKTCFHVLGAALSIFAALLLLLAIAAARERASPAPVIVLICALLFGALGIYMLAGANRWSEAIRRRFPSEGKRKQRTFKPRHKSKAAVGISLGAMTLTLLALLPLQPESYKMPESLLYLVFPLMIVGPLAGIWGAVHLAFHRGQRPTLALLPVGMGLLVLLLSPLAGIALVIVGPALVIAAMPGTAHFKGPRR